MPPLMNIKLAAKQASYGLGLKPPSSVASDYFGAVSYDLQEDQNTINLSDGSLAEDVNVVRASNGLKIRKPQGIDFDYFSEICYDGSGDQEGVGSPLSSEHVDEKESREFLRFASEQADAEATLRAAKQVQENVPDMFEMFKENAKPRVPQWSDRTTGREVSPAEWIRMHYGSRREDGSWHSDGLTRADINQADRKLYLAYAQWIKRHPDDDLNLTTVQRAKAADPDGALERQRAARRRSYHKAKLSS